MCDCNEQHAESVQVHFIMLKQYQCFYSTLCVHAVIYSMCALTKRSRSRAGAAVQDRRVTARAMEAIVNFIKDNYLTIGAIYGAVVALATIIVKLTPTTKDDSVLAWIIKAVDIFSTVNTKEDQKKIDG